MTESQNDPPGSDESRNEITEVSTFAFNGNNDKLKRPKCSFRIEFLPLKEDLPDQSVVKGQIVPTAVRIRPKKREAGNLIRFDGFTRHSDKVLKWRNDCEATLEHIKFFDTCDLVDLPEGRTSLRNHWVASQGMDVNKMSLIIDDLEPANIQNTSLFNRTHVKRCFMAFVTASVQYGWHLAQLDAAALTFYEQISSEEYTDQPNGFDDLSGRKCRFQSVFYEHEKDSLGWYKDIAKKVRSVKFKTFVPFLCIFKRTEGIKEAFLIVDGTDILVGCEDSELFEKSLNDLKTLCTLKEKSKKGPIVFSSMHIQHATDSITLDSREAISDLLKHFKRELAKFNSRSKGKSSKILSTPTPYPDLITSLSGPDLFRPLDERTSYRYRRGTESLVLIADNTRPDILLEAYRLTKFRGNPVWKNWIKLIKLVYYLWLTPNAALVLKKTNSPTLIAYQDTSKTASNLSPRIAVCLFLGSNPILWSSQPAPRDPKKLHESKSKSPKYCNNPAYIIESFIPLLERLRLIDKNEEGMLYTCSRTAEPSLRSYKHMRFHEINQTRAGINEIRSN